MADQPELLGASPQAEDGHTDIAHELMEALAQTRLSGPEFQVILLVIRLTYGWHKKEDPISHGEIAKKTGLPGRTLETAIKGLRIRNMLRVSNESRGRRSTLGLQKDYTKWIGWRASRYVGVNKLLLNPAVLQHPALLPNPALTTAESGSRTTAESGSLPMKGKKLPKEIPARAARSRSSKSKRPKHPLLDECYETWRAGWQELSNGEEPPKQKAGAFVMLADRLYEKPNDGEWPGIVLQIVAHAVSGNDYSFRRSPPALQTILSDYHFTRILGALAQGQRKT